MRNHFEIAVVTNDIYTKEDQRILTEAGALAAERNCRGGNWRLPTHGDPRRCIDESGRCRSVSEKFGNLDVVFAESGGDNLSATFSPELA